MPLTIDKVKHVDDLAEMESALPDDDLEYTLRTLDGTQPPNGKVLYIRRMGDDLYALVEGYIGGRFPVTGNGCWVLVPHLKPGVKPHGPRRPKPYSSMR